MKKEMGLFALGAIVTILVIGATNKAAVFDGIVETTSGGYMFPDGTLQTTGVVVAAAQQFELVGITTAVSADLGYLGLTRKCQAEFGAGTRMCSTLEVVNTVNLPAPAAYKSTAGWVRPIVVSTHETSSVIFDVTSAHDPVNSGKNLDCRGYSDAHNPAGILIEMPGGDAEAQMRVADCGAEAGVACCAPVGS